MVMRGQRFDDPGGKGIVYGDTDTPNTASSVIVHGVTDTLCFREQADLLPVPLSA